MLQHVTITRSITSTIAVLALIAALGLVSCGSSSSDGAALAPAAPPAGGLADTQLNAGLRGGQEVPAVVTGGSGAFNLLVSGDETGINFNLNMNGVFTSQIDQAHIHAGPVGANGPIILFLCTNLGNAPVGVAVQACPPSPGGVAGALSAADLQPNAAAGINTFADAVNAIMTGQAYANVHTATNPGGEIRGQIGPLQFAATLAGDQEVPPVVTTGSGTGTLALNATQDQLAFTLNLVGPFTSDVEQAHIHNGAVGVNGPVFTFLCTNIANNPPGVVVQACPNGTGTVAGTLTAAEFIPVAGLATFADAVDAIITGATYMNMHTVNNPGGEIRGQLAIVP